ncbi:hypothetical protein BDZ45DRAFT_437841 [Acephala macrosclerotiorum]|nr:hypothetical protein BDZ45DRAFT_437841 [Acephala macrosclerotiorum]
MASSTDTENIGRSVVICNAIMISLTTCCIGIRFYSRFFVTKAHGWDDLCIGVGYLFAMVLCVCSIIETRYGLGRHISTVSLEDLGTFLKYNFAAELAYIFSFVASKLTFLFFYLTIFPTGRLRTSSYILAAILVAELIEESAVVLSQCAPLQKAWNVELPGKCLNLLPFFYVSFGIKLATDIALFCLPIPQLGRLKIGLGKKIGVIFMFSLGLFVCIISIVRVTFLQNTSTDITFVLPPGLNWSTIEVCSLVICACIPTFRAILRLFPRISLLLDLSSQQSKFTAPPHGGSYRLESRDRRAKIDTFSHSKSHSTMVGSADNESEVEILQDDGNDGIKVTTSVRIDHRNGDRDLEPNFIFDNNV